LFLKAFEDFARSSSHLENHSVQCVLKQIQMFSQNMVLLNSDVKVRHFRYPEKLQSKVSKLEV